MLSGQLREAACWRTVAEVTRRCPGRMTVIETHGCAFLTIVWGTYEPNEGAIRLQRTGHTFYTPFHLGSQPEQEWLGYLGQVAQADDPREPITNLCQRANLPTGHTLPSATPDVLVYRVIAAFLAHAVFGRPQWRCYNGFWDTSDGGYVQTEYFNRIIPAVLGELQPGPDDLYGQPAYRFWFLLRDGNPCAALQTDGQCWTEDGNWWDLTALYRQHKRIWPVVYDALGYLMP